MKKILIALFIMAVLVGCSKKPKEEYIPILEDNGKTYYVATPSGTIVWSTNSETYYNFVREDGTSVNIADFYKE